MCSASPKFLQACYVIFVRVSEHNSTGLARNCLTVVLYMTCYGVKQPNPEYPKIQPLS